MEYNLSFDYASLVLLLSILVHFYSKRNIKTRQNIVFLLGLYICIISNILDVFSVWLSYNAFSYPIALSYFLNVAYLVCFSAIAFVYFRYIMVFTGVDDYISSPIKFLTVIPFSISVIFIISSPYTKLVFYFDEYRNYLHGPFVNVLYFDALFYVLFVIIECIFHRDKVIRQQRVAIILLFLLTGFGLVYQLIYPWILVSQFFTSISILLVYLSVENPDSYEDKSLGVYNYEAFRHIVMNYVSKERYLNIIMLRLENFKIVNDAMGIKNGDGLVRLVADYLSKVNRKKVYVCRLSGVQFAIIQKNAHDENDRMFFENIRDEIVNRFNDPFELNGIQVTLNPSVYSMSYPFDVKNYEEIIAAVDYSISDVRVTDFNELMNKRARENQILKIMKKALLEEKFEVYYQLIFNNKTGSFNSMEALVRLYDDELGFIRPTEFIPLAEKNGMIVEIGEFVLKSACKFMSSNRLWEKGIEYIEVNLSTIQCMRENWHEKLLEIIDNYGLSYKRINFEITESIGVSSDDILKRSMNMMIDKGVTFSVDDFGTGFSNTIYITEYPYDIVKIDKQIIWSSMENDKAFCALKHTIAMLNEMKLKIVAEGIETVQQADKLASMGCNLFQGFLYARPMPEKDVLKLIEEKNAFLWEDR